jgi:TetR/AcrR family transcriptional regulator, lmrAB and yxaGH operons repressor
MSMSSIIEPPPPGSGVDATAGDVSAAIRQPADRKARASGPDSSRERLVAAMADALRRKGYHGVGLSELLATAQAPKGVLYHHFPGGKAELAVAAIDRSVQELEASLEALVGSAADVAAAFRLWMLAAGKRLAKSGFETGCPLAAVALETGPDDEQLRSALTQAFARIRTALVPVLVARGLAPAKALRMSTLMVSAYEGALIQSRVAGDGKALTDTADMLSEMLEAQLGASAAQGEP